MFFFHDGILVVFNVVFLYGIVCTISYLVGRIFYICCKKVHVQAEVFSKSIIFVNVFCLIFYFFSWFEIFQSGLKNQIFLLQYFV